MWAALSLPLLIDLIISHGYVAFDGFEKITPSCITTPQ